MPDLTGEVPVKEPVEPFGAAELPLLAVAGAPEVWPVECL
jgi:hypothetical protein